MDAINNQRGEVTQQAAWWPPIEGSTGVPPFFPNHGYEPSLAGLTVEEQHWRSRLQAADAATSGYYISGVSGRVRAIEDLAQWLTSPSLSGMAVVTGSPGSGKSALLALPIFLTQSDRRAELLRDGVVGPSSDTPPKCS